MAKKLLPNNSARSYSHSIKIYVFGNTLLKEDNLAVALSKKLKKDFPKIKFIHLDPNEELNEKDVAIMDVASGINKVSVIKNLDQLELGKKISLHDFDVSFFLKLMKKIGAVKKIRIIAIPISYNQKKAYEEVKKIIPTLLLGNEKHSSCKDRKPLLISHIL